MTPTTASPSLVLLNPTAPIAKSAVATDAGAAPDAASSGFELLLGAIQQLQQEPTTSPTSAGESDVATINLNDDNGKALPQLGTILPSATRSQPQTAAKANESPQLDTVLPLVALPQPQITAKSGTTESEAVDNNEMKDKDAEAAAPDALPTMPGFVIAPPPLSGGAAAASNDAVELDLVSAGTGATLFAQSGVVKDSKGGRASASRVETLTGGAGGSEAAAASTAAIASGVKDLQGASMPQAKSDFDVLVKHFEAPTPTQLPAMNNVGDSSGAHQASRTYADAASSGVSVSVPVGSNGWSDAVADKVMWFSANNISSAEIHLNPPDLGPLQVRVSTQHDQASVVFTSQHVAVRDALDQALPRLREMMSSQGMHLLDVSVGGQSAQQQQQQQQQFTRNNSDRGASFGGFFADDVAESAVATVTTVNTARLMRAGVDAYA